MFRKSSVIALLVCCIALTGCSGLFARQDRDLQIANLEQVPVVTSKKTLIPAKRVNKLPSMQLVVNREVQKELTDLSVKSRGTVVRAMEQCKEHYPTITEIFKDEGLPAELVNVAFIESGFNPQAKSPAGAIGMWQFMKSTAKYYGLNVNFHQDERKDMILSSLAAARHLRDLYNNYQDWYLALAAYNVGPGGIEKAMAKGGTRDFWELARRGFLPKETARFVPRILAASLIMNDPAAYGFESASAVG